MCSQFHTLEHTDFYPPAVECDELYFIIATYHDYSYYPSFITVRSDYILCAKHDIRRSWYARQAFVNLASKSDAMTTTWLNDADRSNAAG